MAVRVVDRHAVIRRVGPHHPLVEKEPTEATIALGVVDLPGRLQGLVAPGVGDHPIPRVAQVESAAVPVGAGEAHLLGRIRDGRGDHRLGEGPGCKEPVGQVQVVHDRLSPALPGNADRGAGGRSVADDVVEGLAFCGDRWMGLGQALELILGRIALGELLTLGEMLEGGLPVAAAPCP